LKAKSIAYLVLFGVVPILILGQGTTGELRGLRLKCDGASPGYTLFAPMSSDTTYLINSDGLVVRTWKSTLLPSAWVYFLDNGNVLRGGSDRGNSPFGGGGQGGRFQEFDFDGGLVWDFQYNEPRLPHHDVAVLPNGNILAIAWEGKTADETRRAGRRETAIPASGVWPDMVIEFAPQRPNGGQIVWEWHAWDHLVQNINPALENYADPATRPERIDINGDTSGGGAFSRDIFHTNSIDYNPQLDQILLSVPTYDEIWVIDHSTTTSEAAGRTGGRSGKGGDLLYRWGNPQSYGRGAAADQLLGFQHDARWIPQGRPGAGHLMVFSNRTPGPNGPYTKVYEFVSPLNADGRYTVPDVGPFEPSTPVWTYSDPSLQTTNLSGAERLANGNTLISAGPQGRLFEITPAGDIVWEYWSPYSGASSNNASAFSLFRAVHIRADHPGLAGRDLNPLDPQPRIASFASIGTASGNCPATIPAPTLTNVQPSTLALGTSVDVTLTGSDFAAGMTVDAGEHITVSDVQVIDSTLARVTLSVGDAAPVGPLAITVTTNRGASSPATLNVASPFPDLSIVSAHTGNFGEGFDETYVVTVRNQGIAPSGGVITTTDLLPQGFTFVSGSGPGWSCSAAGQLVTCANSGPLAAQDSTQYALTVAVGEDAASNVNHVVSVALDGDLNTFNNTMSDFTTVVAPSPGFVFTPSPLAPGRQAGVGIVMSTPFPHEVTGSITLTFDSNAVIPVDDPAIQFASGGRTAVFTIPANAAAARFGSDSPEGPLAFQTGTVAGAFNFSGTLTAGRLQKSFTTAGLGALTIPLQALSIQQIQTSTQGGFAVSMLLFSAARQVTQLSLSFNTVPAIRLSCGATPRCISAGNTVTLDVEQQFAQWFNGNPEFGGLAQLRLPFTIEGGAVKGGVAVKLRNTKGESNSQTFALP
jgi:uncharacterized repeat protein (TIGR01451 family)